MKHNYLKHLFTALMLMCVAVATAHDFAVGGIYYSITDATNKTVAVSYRGSYSDSYSNEYTGSVVIPESVTYNGITYSVTSIGGAAFYGCIGLTSIEIPNSVTSIGDGAFTYCSGLTSVVIPNSVTSIGSSAFSECYGLTSIEIPSSVTSVGSNILSYCSSLTSVVYGCAYLGELPCVACYSLKSVVQITSETAIFVGAEQILNSLEQIYSCEVIIPESVVLNGKSYTVTSIGSAAFRDCSGLTSVVIPNSVTSIGDGAFQNCTGLTSIEIPNSVTSIGSGAFYGCSRLASIEIPSSVTSIGSDAFNGTAWYYTWCDNQQDGIAYIGKILYKYIGVMPENTSIKILEGTTGIAGDAFYGCSGLTSIEIPNSVTSIGDGAFQNCTGLTSIEIPNSVTSIEEYAFYGCTGLTSIEIPNSVTSIGWLAFGYCTGLANIEIPNSVTSIEQYAFSNCSRLTSVTSLIPAENLFNAYKAFYRCSSACTLYVPYGAKETYAATTGWKDFTNIVEMIPTEVIVTINQYGSATYCSPYALDFSNVEGLKAYAATGYKSNSQVVTLTRVQTAEAGVGLFLKGEPGEYVVPVIESTDEHSLNMLVGTLEQTVVNSTDGAMSNYKFTIAEGDEAPMFYPFEDGTTLSAGKAYLQIPTAWLPATAQKSVSIRFDEGETTDIDELKGESGNVKTVYDLQGRVVENPTSGIYIVNGKKVIIK